MISRTVDQCSPIQENTGDRTFSHNHCATVAMAINTGLRIISQESCIPTRTYCHLSPIQEKTGDRACSQSHIAMSANHVNTGDNTFSHTHMNAVPTAWKAELINPKTGFIAFSHNQTAMSPTQPNTGDSTICQTIMNTSPRDIHSPKPKLKYGAKIISHSHVTTMPMASKTGCKEFCHAEFAASTIHDQASAKNPNTGCIADSHSHIAMAPIPAKIVDKNPLAVEPALTTQPQASAKNPKVGCMAFSHNQTAISPIPWNTGLSAFSQAHTAAVLIASHAVMKKLRNPSLVFHRYVKAPTSNPIVVIISPIGFVSKAKTLISAPKVVIIAPIPAASLPTTIRIGPSATAKPIAPMITVCHTGDSPANQPTTVLITSISFWKALPSVSPMLSATFFSWSDRRTSRNPPASVFRTWKNLSKPAAPILPILALMFAKIPCQEFEYSSAAAPAFSSKTVFRSSIEIWPSWAIFSISSPVTP